MAQQQKITAASTFSNLGAAESQVSAALAANRSQISQFLAGNSQRMVINHSSSRVVGRVDTRGSTTATPATNIRVVIQRDPTMSSGYRIVTGFPVP
ncbi:RNase A-like domain-containing protein [Cohaesibacter marisflavi]|uniref:RNase A-like domain-containing protein n=1 Tax=Cohaesibacter marisflavi TaxID=655353 RepID=UPI0015877411